MRTITIELIEDEKSGGYTAVSDDIFINDSGKISVIAEGDNKIDALENFMHTCMDIENYLKEEKNAKTAGN